MGMTVREILNTAKPRRTETTTNTAAMGPPVTNAITMENVIMSGARTTRRSSIMYACWTLLTSVVSLVTSELVLKWSMLLNEKRWICANTSWRRLRAKPVEALAQVMPAMVPQKSETSAMSTSVTA